MGAEMINARCTFAMGEEELFAKRMARLCDLIGQSGEAEILALLEGINAAMVIALQAGSKSGSAILKMRDELMAHANARPCPEPPAASSVTTITINPGTVLLVSEILRAERGLTRRPYDEANTAIRTAAHELMRTSAQNIQGATNQ